MGISISSTRVCLELTNIRDSVRLSCGHCGNQCTWPDKIQGIEMKRIAPLTMPIMVFVVGDILGNPSAAAIFTKDCSTFEF